ncbi:MAG: 4Fe-4S binding protein [Eubacteriales bacterium]|nr:4Fe-4S binding protein [Eubacteriales bacterium]
MKKLRARKDIECQNCLACVNACAKAYFKVEDDRKALLQIVPKKKNPNECQPMTCVQCGKCAEACPNNAITQNKFGVYMVNKKLCTGCGACVEACPFKVMRKDESVEYASKCIACGICVKSCPMDILYIENKD